MIHGQRNNQHMTHASNSPTASRRQSLKFEQNIISHFQHIQQPRKHGKANAQPVLGVLEVCELVRTKSKSFGTNFELTYA
jgi:hypothetical protein